MIACETAGGLLLAVWAARGSGPPAAPWPTPRAKPSLPSPCGGCAGGPSAATDPIALERAPREPSSRANGTWLSPSVPVLIGFTLLALYFAKAAFLELLDRGYGVLPGDACATIQLLRLGRRPRAQ